ncbi:MAG: ATP-binding protein [Candidatus Methanosuratus sp.]|nr:ATP-binding protein [Candidatus Methanosuratincola sp.]
MDSVRERQIMIITGLRRTGKTTLMYQAIERLLETEDPRKVLYFSFEEPSPGPKEVEHYEKGVLREPFEDAGRIYVFFDEVQYASGWASTIKRFYDLYPNLKFFVSGSSSLLLSKEALERLAGRFFFLELKPLTFFEFLEMKGAEVGRLEGSKRRAEILFSEYLMKSGFPELAGWGDEAKIAEYIRSVVVDRAILRDIPVIFGSRDIELSERLMGLILPNPGMIANVNALSESLGRSRITVSNYLRYIEASMLVRSLSNFRPAILSSSRKLRKVYPAAPSLIFAYDREAFKESAGAVLETYAVGALGARHYFREGRKEVDMILKGGTGGKEILPVEVKTSVGERDLRKFSGLVEYVGARRGIMISFNQAFSSGNVEVYPAYYAERIFQHEATRE